MAFQIPNDVAGGTTEQHVQATPMKTDFDILAAGLAGDGVLTGCAVTGNNNLLPSVAAGTVTVGGAASVAVAAGTVTITAADGSNPRIDLVVVDNTGAKSVTAGTAAASPVAPAIPANSIVLAMVYVTTSDTTIVDADIIDKRVFVRRATDKITANETGKTDATLVDTGLTFAVSNGVYYAFRFVLNYQTTGTLVGLKVGLTTPTTSRFTANCIVGGFAADGSGGAFIGVINSSGDSVIATGAAAASVDMPCVIEGVILPSADGSLTLQYAAETTGQTVTLMQGSMGELWILS